MTVAEVMEVVMVLCFGASWPFNVMKSYRTRSTKGKSLSFLMLIFIGYLCGIIGKLLAPTLNTFVLFFYVLNMCMVGVDIVLYWRNYRLEKAETMKKEAENVSQNC